MYLIGCLSWSNHNQWTELRPLQWKAPQCSQTKLKIICFGPKILTLPCSVLHRIAIMLLCAFLCFSELIKSDPSSCTAGGRMHWCTTNWVTLTLISELQYYTMRCTKQLKNSLLWQHTHTLAQLCIKRNRRHNSVGGLSWQWSPRDIDFSDTSNTPFSFPQFSPRGYSVLTNIFHRVHLIHSPTPGGYHPPCPTGNEAWPQMSR